MTGITPREKQMVLHILNFADCSGKEVLRGMARLYAELDPFQLERLPALMDRSLEKRAEAKKEAA